MNVVHPIIAPGLTILPDNRLNKENLSGALTFVRKVDSPLEKYVLMRYISKF